VEQEELRAQRENDHVAHQAALRPGRALALCSVAALRPYAMRELMRCSRLPGVGGIKLHLASSEVDLRQPAHLDSLARVVRWVNEARLPLLLHLDTQRRGTDTSHIRDFARVVLEPNPSLSVIVAHLGGSGGYGRWTRSVFRTLGSWLREREAQGEPRAHTYFDVSAVILDQPSEGVPATTDDEAALLGNDLREVGLHRLLFGSDAPSFTPSRVRQGLIDRAGLTAEEVQAILERQVAGLVFR
jgi:predicted TIM-barrel fold metal-dependent hydrolase